MTLYEELGVPRDAAPDTIREAYRNVARLLHPDAQTNPALKESAEVQMKRINHLYGILSDAERRRKYDQELTEPAATGPIIIRSAAAAQPSPRANLGAVVWLGAIAMCATFILWLATRDSSSPVVYPQPAPRRAAVAVKPAAVPDRSKDIEIARLRADLAAAYAERDRLLKQLAGSEGTRRFQPPPVSPQPQQATVVPAPPVLTAGPSAELTLPRPPSVQLQAPPRWTGVWVYRAGREGNRTGAIPPEFIENVVSEDHGHLRGHYRARFRVADRRVSPDVDFQYAGSVSGTSGHFSWSGSGGSRGEVQVRLISNSELEVVWSANDLGKTMGLVSGSAVLNRKN